MLSAEDQAMVDKARDEALRLVHDNVGVAGMRAGGAAYPEVWVRDTVITGLGLAAAGDDRGLRLLRRSMASAGALQSRLGRIPNHVYASAAGAEPVADTMFAGAVDASLWYIVAHHVLGGADDDTSSRLAAAHRWLEYQDVNECGLLEVHESMDWADLFANRYNSLLPNVLWYAANRAMATLARGRGEDGEQFDERAEGIRFRINQLLWVGPEVRRDERWIRENRLEWEYPTRLVDTVLGHRPYYLPYMAFRDFGDRFDTLGNLLAILFGVADAAQSGRIIDYAHGVGLDDPWPVKACWPPITEADKDWREYYRLYNLNYPHQYHNGGAWPFLGGFHVAALVTAGRTDEAEAALVKLARMNRAGRDGEWEFNEWFHGLSGQPMGHQRQSWSAGMFLYAADAVARRAPAFFGRPGRWDSPSS
ncbi:amylo-alpha-1,6-glucosidase [Actinoplanes sp. RD1]|uniref:amylo-alpha-1,6-glucosidase n=1 Tax=Actinoplanes sp. RD1 TaxID=3064538 RepID=UPI002741D5D2|nr:glycoside hydrolase 100 family protein [Actinoplanes sp. RD1]